MRPLCILVTGDPVPSAQQERGDFSKLMREVVGPAWAGPWSVVDCRYTSELPAPDTLAGLIVTGSASSVTEGDAWVLEGMRYLRRTVQAGLPVLGVCFGHQMLAQALGGRVERNPQGREMGTVLLTAVGNDPVVSDTNHPYEVNMSHVDSVVEPPAGASVLGRTRLDPHAALRFAEKAWGVQFHPEFDRTIVGHYARSRADSLRAEGLDPEQLAREATDAHAGAGVLRRFVGLVASSGQVRAVND
jgi:GMP synthase (glutamine-hydrolysing)